MLTFFRRLRQELLAKGSASTYLKYALGEIILVVIGILIALQINNWNETRKEQIRSKEYHERIYQDLALLNQRTESLFELSTNVLKSITKSVELLEVGRIETEEERKTFDFALLWFSRTTYQLPHLATYEEMKGNGDLNLIYDVQLRYKLTDFYNYLGQVETVYTKIGNAVEMEFQVFNRHLRTHVDPQNIKVTYSYDFERMAADEEFVNTFSRLAAHWRGYVYFMGQVREMGDELLADFSE